MVLGPAGLDTVSPVGIRLQPAGQATLSELFSSDRRFIIEATSRAASYLLPGVFTDRSSTLSCSSNIHPKFKSSSNLQLTFKCSVSRTVHATHIVHVTAEMHAA